MSERQDEKDGYGVNSSTRGGAARRGGYGDDQGTRVGEPDEPARSGGSERAESRGGPGPSTRPVNEGLEGAVLSGSGDPGESRTAGRAGAGSEAAEGIHGTQQSTRDPSDRSSLEGAGDVEREGSEPLRERSEEHESGYGGRGGEPKET